jgi:hypothetical protein
MIWFPALAAVAVIRLNQQLEAEKANSTTLQPRHESIFQEKMEYCHRVELFALRQIGELSCDTILKGAPLCLYDIFSHKGLISRKCLSDEEATFPVADGINLLIDNCKRFGEPHFNETGG